MIMTGCHPCNTKTNNKQSSSTTNSLLLDISWSTLTMRSKQKKVSVLDSKSADNINPQHYKSGNIECIDTIKASMTHESFKGYLKGNIQKYIFRYEKKSLEDLQKAEWYLTRLIQECKKYE